MIAIPDFSSGAMENWGLVTYRETCILVDPANSSQSSKQWVMMMRFVMIMMMIYHHPFMAYMVLNVLNGSNI